VTGNKLCTFIEHSNNNGKEEGSFRKCELLANGENIKLLQVAIGTRKVAKLDKLRKHSNELGFPMIFQLKSRSFLICETFGALLTSTSSLKATRKNLQAFSL
jgi:hypothetical protein